MGRRLQDNLPCIVKPENKFTRDLPTERLRQKAQHDNHRNLTDKTPAAEFTPGQKVRLQHHITKEWSLKGTVISEVAPRSYDVKMDDGNTLRRNRKSIRRIYSLCSDTQNELDEGERHNHDMPSTEEAVDSDATNVYMESNSELTDDDISGDDLEYDSDRTEPHDEHENGSREETATEDDSDATEAYAEDETENQEENNYVTRSGRICRIKRPMDYEDLMN